MGGNATQVRQPSAPVVQPLPFSRRRSSFLPVDLFIGFRPPETLVVSPKLAVTIVALTNPVIEGTATAGMVLKASPGTWSGTPPLTFAYQWRRCNSGGTGCSDIAGATGPEYIVQAADVGGTIRVVVTATDL
jgi:hypothetical protein